MPSRSKNIPIIMPVFVKDFGWKAGQSGKKNMKKKPARIESTPKILSIITIPPIISNQSMS